MWILDNNEKQLGVNFYLDCGGPIIIGRKAGLRVSLLNDKSISREHAQISLKHEDCMKINKLPEVTLQDLSSKYGTYINNGIDDKIRVDAQSIVKLKHGDYIRFGLLENKWQLIHHPLVISTSQITQKDELKLNMLFLGGFISKDWTNECTLLVMDNLMLTAKTVCAMAAASFIVTPSYLSALKQAVESNSRMPEPARYLPQLKERSINSALVSFVPDQGRKTLFSNKIFLFQTKPSFKRMHKAVSLAGGEAVEISESNYHQCVRPNSVIIKVLEKESDMLLTFANKAAALVKQHNLNLIPESDIGLAIVYKNVEKHCNPHFRINNILKSSTQAPSPSQNLIIYATETQDMLPSQVVPSVPLYRTTIPESGDSTKGKSSNACNKSMGQASIASSTLTMYSNTLLSHHDDSSISTVNNKENALQRLKRGRFDDDVVDDPPSKRPTTSRLLESADETLEITQKFDSSDVNSLNFLPPVHSTERQSPIKQEQISNDCKSNVTIGEPTTTPAQVEHAAKIVKSTIPMASLQVNPFTLSSFCLNEKETSVSSSPPRFSPPKLTSVCSSPPKATSVTLAVGDIKRETATPSANSWITNTVNKSRHVITETPDSTTPSRIKENPSNPGNDPFALPAPSQRRKRARDFKEETSMSESKHSKTNDPFALPAPTIGRNRSQNTIKRNISTIEKEEGVKKMKETVSEQKCPKEVNNQPFMSTIKNDIASYSKTDRLQQELLLSTNDIDDDLAKTLEKSLIVVEVVSLVLQTSQSTDDSRSSTPINGLPNFKKFRKARLSVTCRSINSNVESIVEEISELPRIIGGQDLIIHSDNAIEDSRMEEFLATQPREDAADEESSGDRLANLDFDAAFKLTAPTLSRRVRNR